MNARAAAYFNGVRDIPLVNPEVHHSRYVPDAIAFCEKLFSST